MPATRRFWGWGVEGAGPDRAQQEKMGETIAARFGAEPRTPIDPPTIDELDLRAPRVTPPDSLAHLCTVDPEERAGHTYGKSFRDVWRALHRDFSQPPDLVAIPRDENDIAALLDWCSDEDVAAIPYGGESSVVGGVECDVDDVYVGAVSIDLRALDQVVEVDRTSRAARVQAGIYGPALEDELAPHGLTLRHFPQSFEFSTLGGWLATRAGGHYATGPTHIDDHCHALTLVTPRGTLATHPHPASGAGPEPARLVLGSAGALELARDHGGEVSAQKHGSGDAQAWKQAFFDAPYLQSSLLSIGIMSDTFETACTWTQFPALHAAVTRALHAALDAECGGGLLA